MNAPPSVFALRLPPLLRLIFCGGRGHKTILRRSQASRRTNIAGEDATRRAPLVDILAEGRCYLGGPARFQAAGSANLANAGSEVEPVFFMIAAR